MKVDLHIHSIYSGDSKLEVEDIAARCKALGIKGFAIVDHNSIEGSIRAMNMRKNDIIVLPGIEITCSTGHVIGYGITELIPRDMSVEETIEYIHDSGGIAVAPHPYRWWSGIGAKEILKNKFDAIETINARSSFRSNDKAANLRAIIGCAETGGSDAHSLRQIGAASTIFSDNCEDADDLIFEILEKSTRAEGSSRKPLGTIGYGVKCISEWVTRGMRRL
ncbi:MAG: PHP-associated domain-containing protein [Methanomassiliicoccales archaeon]